MINYMIIKETLRNVSKVIPSSTSDIAGRMEIKEAKLVKFLNGVTDYPAHYYIKVAVAMGYPPNEPYLWLKSCTSFCNDGLFRYKHGIRAANLVLVELPKGIDLLNSYTNILDDAYNRGVDKVSNIKLGFFSRKQRVQYLLSSTLLQFVELMGVNVDSITGLMDAEVGDLTPIELVQTIRLIIKPNMYKGLFELHGSSIAMALYIQLMKRVTNYVALFPERFLINHEGIEVDSSSITSVRLY